MERWRLTIAVVALALLAAGCGDAWRDDAQPSRTPPDAATEPTASPSPGWATDAAPAPAATEPAAASPDSGRTPAPTPVSAFGDGTFVVGIDIAHGRYRADSPDSCRWTVWISWDEFWGWYSVVEIGARTERFGSRGCGTWTALTPIATPGQPFGDGTFVVGVDIAAGRYRSTSAADDCHWELLSTLTGIRRAVFGERPGASSSTIADISPETAGFYSTGCGRWSTDLSPIVAPGEPFGDGAFLVGPEIAPGRYRSSGAGSCWWERRSGFSGSHLEDYRNPRDVIGDVTYRETRARAPTPSPATSTRDVIGDVTYRETLWFSVVGGLPSGVHTIVDIEDTDTGFFSDGCGVWTRDPPPRAARGEPFGDGAFLVGPEIAPGRYLASGPGVCRWARLERFGGAKTDIAESAAIREGDPAIVEIEETDAGFVSLHCGEWTRAP